LSWFEYFCHVVDFCHFLLFWHIFQSYWKYSNNDRKMTKKYNASRKMSFLQPAKSSPFCHSCHLVDLFVFFLVICWCNCLRNMENIKNYSVHDKQNYRPKLKWQKNDKTVTKTITDKTELTRNYKINVSTISRVWLRVSFKCSENSDYWIDAYTFFLICRSWSKHSKTMNQWQARSKSPARIRPVNHAMELAQNMICIYS
jgi:hypothetical protein